MKNGHLFITLLLIALVSSGAFAQSKAKLERANDEFAKYNFDAAIPLYLSILEKTDLPEAKIKLAESYRKVGNHVEAEYWYGQVVFLPDAEPKHFLYYAMALQANNKCDLAKEYFEEYAQRNPEDLRGQLLAQTCDKKELERLLRKSQDFYEIIKLPINTHYDDFGPVKFKNGIVFASERDNQGPVTRIHEWTGYPFLELFFTEVDTINAENFEFAYEKKPGKFNDKDANTKYHDGPISFSPDYKKVFITRNNLFKRKVGRDDEGVVRLKIYTADLKGDRFENVAELPFNSDEYSVAHPTLGSDGKTLYFSSDMPGGFGGMDLYFTIMESDGGWSAPQNMGPAINTEGHEVFPYYHHESDKLYFSSDGHIGLGMLDVNYIQKIDGAWGPVINLGAGINSNEDDFGLMMNDDETFGYFTSNRTGGAGRDDIYAFKKSVVEVELLVYDKVTGDPIPQASVFNDCSTETIMTANNGRATIEMAIDKCCSFTANKATYTENTLESCTNGYEAGTKMVVRIPLSRPLEFDLEGLVVDITTGEPINMATVTVSNDCDEDEITLETGPDGTFSVKDLNPDCCYFVTAAKIPYYLAPSQPARVCTRGKTESETLRVTLELEPTVVVGGGGILDNDSTDIVDITKAKPGEIDPTRLGSRTFILEHIYYDFDKSYIRDDAVEDLTKLLDILNANPEYVVEIGSHTDARGSHRYNDRLSQRRAKAVVRWLEERGVTNNRVVPVGYGENQTTNGCEDEIPCTEEQHQRNRRTEFRILGTVDGVRFNNEVARSVPKTYVRTDPCVGCPF